MRSLQMVRLQKYPMIAPRNNAKSSNGMAMNTHTNPSSPKATASTRKMNNPTAHRPITSVNVLVPDAETTEAKPTATGKRTKKIQLNATTPANCRSKPRSRPSRKDS